MGLWRRRHLAEGKAQELSPEQKANAEKKNKAGRPKGAKNKPKEEPKAEAKVESDGPDGQAKA